MLVMFFSLPVGGGGIGGDLAVFTASLPYNARNSLTQTMVEAGYSVGAWAGPSGGHRMQLRKGWDVIRTAGTQISAIRLPPQT